MTVGRPTKFTTETKEKLLHALSKGASYELACNYAGICYTTFLRNMKKGKEENSEEYRQFCRDLKEVEGDTALIWLAKIDQAMEGGAWQAAAWKLERRYPETYGREAAAIQEAKEMNKKLDKLLINKESNNGEDVHKESD